MERKYNCVDKELFSGTNMERKYNEFIGAFMRR